MTVVSLSPITDEKTVKSVQTKLRELGIHNADLIDGSLAEKTQASILDFRNRNKLELVPQIDAKFLAALAAAKPIERPVRQVVATMEEIAPKVEAIQKTWWAKIWARITAFPALAMGVILAMINNLDEAVTALSPLKSFLVEFLSGVSPLTVVSVGALSVGCVALIMATYSQKAENSLVKGYQEGTVKFDPPVITDPVVVSNDSPPATGE